MLTGKEIFEETLFLKISLSLVSNTAKWRLFFFSEKHTLCLLKSHFSSPLKKSLYVPIKFSCLHLFIIILSAVRKSFVIYSFWNHLLLIKVEVHLQQSLVNDVKKIFCLLCLIVMHLLKTFPRFKLAFRNCWCKWWIIGSCKMFLPEGSDHLVTFYIISEVSFSFHLTWQGNS